MSLAAICNESMTVEFDNKTGPPDLTYTADPGIDTVKVVPVLSGKCLAGSKVAAGPLTVTWTVATGGCPYTSATHVFIAGAAVVAASAAKVATDVGAPLRVGDESAIGCAGTWTPPAGPPALACTCGVTISDAGQTKAKAQ